MNVAQLVALLKTLPQDMEVLKCKPSSCCCGECSMSLDEYAPLDRFCATVERPYGIGADGTKDFVVI